MGNWKNYNRRSLGRRGVKAKKQKINYHTRRHQKLWQQQSIVTTNASFQDAFNLPSTSTDQEPNFPKVSILLDEGFAVKSTLVSAKSSRFPNAKTDVQFSNHGEYLLELNAVSLKEEHIGYRETAKREDLADVGAPSPNRQATSCRMNSDELDDGIAQLPVQEICRTCLDRVPSDTCKSIFTDNIQSVVTMISNVELMEGDGLPPNVCDKCFKQLEAVMQFKMRIESSDATLRMPSVGSIKVEQGYAMQSQSIPTDIEQNVQIKEEPVIEHEDVELNYEPASLTGLKHEEEEVFAENHDIDVSFVKNEYDDPLKFTEKEQEVSVNFAGNYINEESEHIKFKKKRKASQNVDINFMNNGDGKFEEGKRISEKPNSKQKITMIQL